MRAPIFTRTIPSAVQCWHWDRARCMSACLAVTSTWQSYVADSCKPMFRCEDLTFWPHQPSWTMSGPSLLTSAVVLSSFLKSGCTELYHIPCPCHLWCTLTLCWRSTDITCCLSSAVCHAVSAALLSQPSRASPFKMALRPLNPSVIKF